MAEDKLPSTMKAWAVAKNGAPRDALVLETNRAVPPAPTGSYVVIKVAYAALNPADLGLFLDVPYWLPWRRRPIPGIDFSGEVVQAGPDVPAELPVGTPVGGSLNVRTIFFGGGSLAEYITVPAHILAVKPEGLDFAQAAGLLGVAGQTACITLTAAGVKKGEKVLINGASGGVGTLLTQAVKARGVTVYGVSSQANADMVKRLGADVAIDYKAHAPVTEYLAQEHGEAPFDTVLDLVGDFALYDACPKYLKPKGKFITIAGGRSFGIIPTVRNNLLPVALGGVPRSYRLMGLNPAGALAKEAAEWANAGMVKEVPIDSEYKMEDAVEAYERLGSKRSKGKIVVRIG